LPLSPLRAADIGDRSARCELDGLALALALALVALSDDVCGGRKERKLHANWSLLGVGSSHVPLMQCMWETKAKPANKLSISVDTCHAHAICHD
jgi:hypothetical protein